MRCTVLPKINDVLVTALSKSVQISENTIKVVQTEKHIKQLTQEQTSFGSEIIIKVLYAWARDIYSPDYVLGILDIKSYNNYLYVLGYIIPPNYPVLIKMDGNFNVLWSKIFNVSSQQHVDIIIFDDGIMLVQRLYPNLLVAKFDHDGNLLWQKQISDSTGTYQFTYYIGGVVKKDNNIIIIANAYSTVDDGTYTLIMKLDSDGNILQSNIIKLTNYTEFAPYAIGLISDSIVIVGEASAEPISPQYMNFILILDNDLQPQKLITFLENNTIQINSISINNNKLSIVGYREEIDNTYAYIIQLNMVNDVQVVQSVSIYADGQSYIISHELPSYVVTLDDDSIIAGIPLGVGGGGK